MPHNGIKGTFRDALHTTPAATHIDEGRILSVKANECIAPAHFFRCASQTDLTKRVINFERNGTGSSYGHIAILPYSLSENTLMSKKPGLSRAAVGVRVRQVILGKVLRAFNDSMRSVNHKLHSSLNF